MVKMWSNIDIERAKKQRLQKVSILIIVITIIIVMVRKLPQESEAPTYTTVPDVFDVI